MDRATSVAHALAFPFFYRILCVFLGRLIEQPDPQLSPPPTRGAARLIDQVVKGLCGSWPSSSRTTTGRRARGDLGRGEARVRPVLRALPACPGSCHVVATTPWIGGGRVNETEYVDDKRATRHVVIFSQFIFSAVPAPDKSNKLSQNIYFLPFF
jgi:hypothetical protein